MSENQVAFILASVVLLSTPGPTNALLAISGAAVGMRRSLSLLAAELTGYMVSILVLRALVGPLIAAVPVLAAGLRFAVVGYLIYLAAKFWKQDVAASAQSRPVTFSQVLVTTLLNPKGIIFAFSILPQQASIPELFPWLSLLTLQIATIGCCWIAAGAALRHGLRSIAPAGVEHRASAIVLLLLALAMGADALRGLSNVPL